jgi:hypothetical protein
MDWNRYRALQSERAGAAAAGRARDSKAARRDAEAICKEKLDRALDEGLEESFPGSDPVSVTLPPSSPYDRPKRSGTLR